MANVYWIKGRVTDVRKNMLSNLDVLLGLEEMARLVVEDQSLAIKINLSEMGYSHYLRPVITSWLFDKIRAMGAKPLVTDGCSLMKGSRFDGYSWMDSALVQGFSAGEIFENQLMLAAGYTNEEGKFWPSEGNHLAGVDIGSLLTDIHNVLILAHVTAHPLLGIAGAVYNLGLGFLTGSGKLKVHSFLEIDYDAQKCDHCAICLPYCPTGALNGTKGRITFDPRTCNLCLGCLFTCPREAVRIKSETIPVFQQCVVEAAHTVKERIRGSAFYISFLNAVTPQTDEYPYSDTPFIPDLGILASEDPVALDWATYHMILRSPGLPGSIAQDLEILEKGQDKIKTITGTTPVPMLEYAVQMGLGATEFEFLSGS